MSAKGGKPTICWHGHAQIAGLSWGTFAPIGCSAGKLRGINVFPHAIGALIENRADLTGEFVCRLRREPSGRDAMLVVLESRGGSDRDQLAGLLRQGLGVEVEVELCGPGGTAAATQIEVRQKPLRLIDERGR